MLLANDVANRKSDQLRERTVPQDTPREKKPTESLKNFPDFVKIVSHSTLIVYLLFSIYFNFARLKFV